MAGNAHDVKPTMAEARCPICGKLAHVSVNIRHEDHVPGEPEPVHHVSFTVLDLHDELAVTEPELVVALQCSLKHTTLWFADLTPYPEACPHNMGEGDPCGYRLVETGARFVKVAGSGR